MVMKALALLEERRELEAFLGARCSLQFGLQASSATLRCTLA